ncbi:MAG: biliverdin-producing heme oxygenase [Sphingomonas sp.]
MTPAHRALRDGTRDAHDRLDALFARFDLSSPAGYADFLAAHAEALLPIEAALDASPVALVTPDWPARRRGGLIAADLAALGRSVPPVAPQPPIADPVAIAGTLYVIEGSRLGGKVLARQVGPDFPLAYLDAPQEPGGWRALLTSIDSMLHDGEETARAVGAAIAIFDRFYRAGRQWLGPDSE